MANIQFEAEIREGTGKGAARKARAAGKIPGVLYGEGAVPVTLQVERKAAERIIRHMEARNVMADLVVQEGGKKQSAVKVLLKEIQSDPISGTPIHLDFYRIRMDRALAMDIPIRLLGSAAGVEKGGILEQELREIHIEALPDRIPEAIEVDISALEMRHSIFVKDLTIPDGVKVVEDMDRVVVSVLAPRVEEEAAPAAEAETAEAAEPEVISEEKTEERRKKKEEEQKTEEKKKEGAAKKE